MGELRCGGKNFQFSEQVLLNWNGISSLLGSMSALMDVSIFSVHFWHWIMKTKPLSKLYFTVHLGHILNLSLRTTCATSWYWCVLMFLLFFLLDFAACAHYRGDFTGNEIVYSFALGTRNFAFLIPCGIRKSIYNTSCLAVCLFCFRAHGVRPTSQSNKEAERQR